MGNNPNWTYDEFLAFTLLYASSVDAKISDDEVKLIICKVGDDVCNKMFKEFSKLNEYERLQTILSFKELYFKDDKQKQKLLSDIKQLFLVDKKFDNLERGILFYLNRLL
ncbi:MAG TPA: hypothetical protein P5050_09425 [Bacteroidia bacterium]|nr:hypothetical protein [Sphingobacteriales bacterium]HPD65935.1 hypothetical protein [Bacteroidia bacterium]HRS59428.1 hypothetical protein [Bacteroidia bacterium]HRU68631.1 hypothetical protein [Bacteroidia bacterium]